jgi:myo-inositol-hexaphosphate 3-phosphohydrolase
MTFFAALYDGRLTDRHNTGSSERRTTRLASLTQAASTSTFDPLSGGVTNRSLRPSGARLAAKPLRRPALAFAALLSALFMLQIPFAHAATVSVTATVETTPMPSSGDAADDSAIWIHPTDPALSIVIGTNKSDVGGGLAVYDLSGRQLHYYADGRLNNVDVRYNFPLGSSRVSLVGATNRLEKRVDYYKVNPSDRSLTKVGSVPTSSAIGIPRGFAFYHSPVSGKYYAFVTDSGQTDQYELSGATGSVTGTLVRHFSLRNATEGLVADDELKRLYLAEEDIGGIWRYGAEPGDGTTGTKIDSTTETGGNIIQDVKGLALYYGSNGTGYLLAASQGSDLFHVYNRGDNAHLGSFRIVAGNGIDEVTGEDGIDVTSFGLGPIFPQGFFMSQDHTNGGANQNFKLVPWQSIANAFTPQLTIDTSWDPRTVGDGGGGGEDTTPPDTLINSGPSGTVASTTAEFTFVATESGSSFECSLDGAAFSLCSSPKSYSALATGSHTFEVRAKDPAGNTDPSPASRTWVVDTSAATTATFPAEADAAVEAATPTTNFGGATSLKVDASPQEESYLRFSVQGMSGMVTSAKLRVYAFNGSIDGPAVYTTGTAWSETEITWNARPARTSAALADKAAIAVNSWVEYDVTPAVTGNGSYSFDLGATSSDGVDLNAREAAANRPELVVTSSGGEDASPPDTTIESGPSGRVNYTTAQFAFSASEAGSIFECSLDGAAFSVCTSPATYTGLTEGSHSFQARAIDESGNTDPTPASRTWTVDTTTPVVARTTPPDGATGASTALNVQATFSEAIDPATLTTTSFTLTRSADATPVPATVTYDAATQTATLDPGAGLASSTSYTATVTTAVRDLAGNPLTADAVWSFVTSDAPQPSAIVREAIRTTANGSATSSITIAKPTGTVEGDFLVACVALNGSNVAATGTPAGWSRIAAVTTITNPRVFGYYKVAGSTEPADYTWTLTASVQNGGGIARYSGVDSAVPLDVAAKTASGTAALSGTVPGVTTMSANAMLVGCMAVNSSKTNLAISSPGGLAEAWDIGGKRHELADGLQTLAGPSGDKTWTFNASRAWAGWLAALKPD